MQFWVRNIILGLLLLLCTDLAATHNRAGEITYRQIGPLTIEATITTYTKASSTSADRDTLELLWGDGTSSKIARQNGDGTLIPGADLKVNYYIMTHTYPGRSTYTMSFIDPNRVSNILNLNHPNSVDVKFYVSTTFTLLDDQFQGYNNSAVLLQAPIDFACVNRRFIHNPNAFDLDGDSLAYELVTPLQDENDPVPNYLLPNQIQPGPGNFVSLDASTGDFVWNSPKSPGEYNIAILIKEYRQGVLINKIIRDMQILVDVCDDFPPEIETVEEICIVAGEELKLPVIVTDPDEGQLVRLTASGGMFQFIDDQYVDWDNTGDLKEPEFSDTLVWRTQCHHVREEAYQIVFRAVDNSMGSNQGLANLKTVQVYVMAPPPLDMQADAENQTIQINWESPYRCEDAQGNYFQGFSVWRKVGSNPFERDTCVNGLEGKGYEIIEYLTSDTLANGRYFYDDQNIEVGKVYCYRVLANFALTTSGGFIYNIVESLPSDEVCETAFRNVPLLTNVDVMNTDQNTGEIFLTWVKAIPDELDTIENPGPYRYQLQRSLDNVNFTDIVAANFNSPFFASSVDTSFLDTNLNTVDNSYYYRIDFYSNGNRVDFSPSSESTYLSIVASDTKNFLNWNAETSWQNYEFTVERFNDISGEFEFLASTPRLNYEDSGLTNDLEYCYRIQTIGSYGLEATPSPILNYSQIVCATPIDTVGPCAPVLMVENECEDLDGQVIIENLQNQLAWNSPALVCDGSQDLAGFNIYYSNLPDNDFEIIQSYNSPSELNATHFPEGGSIACYFVRAFDESGNESISSDTICIDNCPQYELPNTFTPNGDGSNDIFLPRKNRFIDKVQFEIFNEWGNKVYETDDPAINWDGKDEKGRDVEEGVYFYNCTLFELVREDNLQETNTLSGYIQIIR